MKAYEGFQRVGVEKQRSYYIPFAESDRVKYRYGIVDRKSSSEFMSLDGAWKIKAYERPEAVDITATEGFAAIPVPSCVQMHGYDQIQYINCRYPFPCNPPYVPHKNPTWHLQKRFALQKGDKAYYLNFEGVDSFFYVYVNGVQVGYSQISHATSEFCITQYLKDGDNVLDVVVLKWCASSYLECQDKFRFSGIFRSVYLLERPKKHLVDYRVKTDFADDTGVMEFYNDSDEDAVVTFAKKRAFVAAKGCVSFAVKNVKKWSAETPNLYPLEIAACGEKIIEKVGFRKITIEGPVFKINGEAVKLKGVNRHESSPTTGATVTLLDTVKDLRLMKELNVNAIRTSHYPDQPEFYQLCDAFGFFVMDECDLETHGAATRRGDYELDIWNEFAENELFSEGIYDRCVALVERDKNRPCVIMWSLGNESGFGKAFFKGAEYIRARDERPVHYEGLQNADKKYYFTEHVDVVSYMYPSLDWIKENVLNNEAETRPFVLCEYTHAMGNSCGDISQYWELIYNNPQMFGAFVWEWADHAVKTKEGYLYGGDCGERNHDGNFCADGLLSPDRKIKSGAREMQAVYAGKLTSEKKRIAIPKTQAKDNKIDFILDEDTGAITSLTVDGKEILRSPMTLNILRYVDNEMKQNDYKLFDLAHCAPYTTSCEKTKNGYKIEGVMIAECCDPAVAYTLRYEIVKGGLKIGLKYKIADWVKRIPRFGLEFAVAKEHNAFSYVGYGPYESYVDKHVASEYGYYQTTAEENFTPYVRPQETGSHYDSEYLNVQGILSVMAEKPFSFSVLPYETAQLFACKHTFELKKHGIVNVCLDLAMRGVGSYSCGPELDEKYEIPRESENVFTLLFE